jgi:transcriptional regulator with XRE-family HTH domain
MTGAQVRRWRAAELRRWRLARGWSQRQAAEWYGCSTEAWRSWEGGRRPIPAHVARRLAGP